MSSAGGSHDRRFPWTVAFLGAALFVATLATLLRLPEAPAVSAIGRPPAVEFVRLDEDSADSALQEAAALRNPEPLFLATEVNAGQVGALSDDERNESVAAFRNFPPDLVYGDRDPVVNFPPAVAVPPEPVAALRRNLATDAFDDLGRRDAKLEPLPRRLGYLRVARAADGAVVLEMELPPAEGRPQGDWAPAELMAAVDLAGLVGRLVVTATSGSAEMDDWLVSHLAGKVKLGQRLGPGIYHISIGP